MMASSGIFPRTEGDDLLVRDGERAPKVIPILNITIPRIKVPIVCGDK
jgi:hypothetical protein